jgi:hypothetical protein
LLVKNYRRATTAIIVLKFAGHQRFKKGTLMEEARSDSSSSYDLTWDYGLDLSCQEQMEVSSN